MTEPSPRLRALAPQFLVDDLPRMIDFYRGVLGFRFGEPWQGFCAVGQRDGVPLHLKEAPKNLSERAHRRDREHLDAYGDIAGIDRVLSHAALDAGLISFSVAASRQKRSAMPAVTALAPLRMA